MSEAITAAPQPQATEATGGDTNSEVGENMTASAVKAMLFKRDMARHEAQAAPAEVQAPAETPEAQPDSITPAEDAPEDAPQPEATAEPEDENPEATPEDSDDVHSHLSKLDPVARLAAQKALEAWRKKDQESINKRLGKEVWRRKNLEGQLQEAQAKHQELAAQIQQRAPQANTPAYDPAIPLSDVNDAATLSKRAQEAKDTVRYVNDALDMEGIENGVQIGDKVWTKAELKAVRRNAQITLEDHIPARTQFLQQRQQTVTSAISDYPFLNDPKSEGYAMAQKIVGSPQFSWLKSVPNAAEILGGYVEGQLAKEARKKAPVVAKPVVLRPKPSSDQTVISAVGGGDRSAVNRGRNAVEAERAKLNASGNVTGADLKSFLKLSDAARR